MKSIIILLLSLSLASGAIAENPSSWTEPVEPFTIVGNVHYVGTAELSSYLITTPAGHILLDAPMEENVPHLVESIRALGFDPADIEIMIGSHAHFDHAGGFAGMKTLTGAELLISAEDAELLRRGGRDDFAFGDRAAFAPVEVDRTIVDGEIIELGGTSLRAVLTPGHTKGGTSWVLHLTDDGRPLTVLFANSMSAPGYDLVENESYPQIMSDYRGSFDRLATIEADAFLSTHGSFFRLPQKADALRSGADPNPFVDPDESKRFVARWREIIETQYGAQKAEDEIATTLDAFHEAASKANLDTYFSILDRDGVFIGTDPHERWTAEEFRRFVEPYFSAGRGWTYVPTSRFIEVDDTLDTAWFDEILENKSYGTTRGSGVLVRVNDRWRIAQYHLTIPIPNEITKDVVEMIRGSED